MNDLVELRICYTLDQMLDLIDSEKYIPIYQGKRYVRCLNCERTMPSHFFLDYGGQGHRKNYGHCRECMLNAQRLENFL